MDVVRHWMRWSELHLNTPLHQSMLVTDSDIPMKSRSLAETPSPNDTLSNTSSPLSPSSPLSEDPVSSIMPSYIPSFFPSDMPSDRPSTAPSLRPIPELPSTITARPTLWPSATPTVVQIEISRNQILMVLQNMPPLENSTSIEDWQDATTSHINSYWNTFQYSPIEITEVITVLLYQEVQQVRRRLDEDVISHLRIYYQQNISFAFRFESDIVKDDDDAIFLDPLERNEAAYVDALTSVFNLAPDADIRVLQTTVMDDVTPTLSPSATKTPAPASFVSNADGGLGVGAIVLITSAIFVVLTVGLCGYLYLRKRQHEHDMAWATDPSRSNLGQEHQQQHHHDEDEFRPEMEDAPTIDPSVRSSPREMPVVDEGDEENQDDDDFADPQSSPRTTETYLHALSGDDGEDDPTSPYTPDSPMGDQNGGSIVESLNEDDADVDNDDELQPVSPLQGTSSSDDSAHDPPSLWAFQVKVTDLDD